MSSRVTVKAATLESAAMRWQGQILRILVLVSGGALGLAQPSAPPFAGLDQASGVYVTVDGHGITIRQSAVDWDFYLPDGSEAEWKKGRGSGQPPHIEITCRAVGGYRSAAEPQAVWTVPRPDGMPKRLGRKQRKRWKRLWPWTFGDSFLYGSREDAVDHGLSAIVEGGTMSLSKNGFTVRMRFQWDPWKAVAGRRVAKHC